MQQEVVAIKIGGKAAAQSESLKELIREMASLEGNYRFIMIHGGGAEVSRVTRIFGLEPVFIEGKRMTSPEEMEIVDMVLSGKMNKSIVRMFRSLGVNAVGVSGSDGGIFTGESIEGSTANATRTGVVTNVDTKLLDHLLSGGYLPVIASTSMDSTGGALNINADEAAFELASALPAARLVFLSDIPGILKDGEVLRKLTPAGIQQEIGNGTVSGGMIPKVRSSVGALEKGVGSVIIGEYREAGDLEALLAGRKGSRISENRG